MNTEHKPTEILGLEWHNFLNMAEKAFEDTQTEFNYSVTQHVIARLRKCHPVPFRDAEQLPRLRLKRKHQRKAYRDLQRAYERVRQWWLDAAKRNQPDNGVYSYELSAEYVKRHTSENGMLVIDPSAVQPEDGA